MSAIPTREQRAVVRANDAKSDNPFIRAIARICEIEEDLEGVRAMTVETHRSRLEAVCRDAVTIEAAKAQMGFPPSAPNPWPTSTWELLKRLTANVQPH